MANNWQEDAEEGWSLLEWEGEAQWFATKEQASRKLTLGGRLTSLDQLIGTIRNAEALGWNLYLQANPSRRTSKIKLSRADITHWRYIVVDMDPSEMALTPPNFHDRAHRIFSGRGYQAWIPIWAYDKDHTDSLPHSPIDPDDPGRYERLMAGYLRFHKDAAWLNGWVIDNSCADLARVVRCPGSINQKTGKRSEVEFSFGTGKFIADLLNLEQAAPAPVKRVCENTMSLVALLPHLTVTATRFLLDGVSTPGRHAAAWHTVKLMHELGVGREQAIQWIRDGMFRCRPVDGLELDIIKMIRRLYDR